jgi:capsular polysaccharide biosynthesis protein
MDFAEAFRVITRRWRLAVPVLVLTVIVVALVYVGWPTKYQSTAQLSLIANHYMADQPANGNNPYVAISTLGPLAGILVGELSSDQAAQQLRKLGMTNGFTAAVPPFTAGPFVTLTVTGPNSLAVRDSMPIVVSFAQQRLQQLQKTGNVGTPEAALIQAIVISPPSSPQPVSKPKIELMAGVAIAGLLLLLLLSFEAEGRALRRAEDLEMSADQRVIDRAHPSDEPTIVLDRQEELQP